jgi:hypothetical protein
MHLVDMRHFVVVIAAAMTATGYGAACELDEIQGAPMRVLLETCGRSPTPDVMAECLSDIVYPALQEDCVVCFAQALHTLHALVLQCELACVEINDHGCRECLDYVRWGLKWRCTSEGDMSL